MTLDGYTTAQLAEMEHQAFEATDDALDKMIGQLEQLADLPYPSPQHTAAYQRLGVLKADVKAKEEHYRALGAELNRRYAEQGIDA